MDRISSTRETAAAILDIAECAPDVFVGGGGTHNHLGTVFGGRLLAQALHAAVRTVETMLVTSLHAYFLAAGDTARPLEYSVTRLRDSRRFANRQVAVLQGGQTIFMLMCQFHAPEAGFTHQFAEMPAVAPPEAVASVQDFVRGNDGALDPAIVHNFAGALPIEMKPVAPEDYFLRRPAKAARDFWFRLPSAGVFDDPRLQQCLLAFSSDYWLAGVSALPHVVPTNSDALLISSLDHAIWFHRPARCDDWLLHHTVSPQAGDGLGLAQGRIFDRAGNLVASTAQECLLRRLRN